MHKDFCLLLYIHTDMLFRTTTGDLIAIQRANYVTDAEYYRHIMKTIDPVTTLDAMASHTAAQFSSLRSIAKVVPVKHDIDNV